MPIAFICCRCIPHSLNSTAEMLSKIFFNYFLIVSTSAMMININTMMQTPKEFRYYNGTDITWFDAVKLCEEKGGVLAHFDNVHDHLLALKRLPNDGRVWIGYR